MKTEELILVGAAAVGAYFLLREPPKKTVGSQIGDLINTVFSPGQVSRPAVMPQIWGPDTYTPPRNLITADISPSLSGVVGMVPTPRGDLSSALLRPDNGAVTHVDYSGATPFGMPIVDPSFNNNTISAPIYTESLGIPATALQSPEAWQNGAAQYIGDTPPPLAPETRTFIVDTHENLGIARTAGLARVNPDYQLQPFEWFRTDAGGNRFVVSALSGEDIKYLEWAGD